ncbi:MAG: tRNA lysidine(34) synthetase TilS [Helicobacteraceae bacterium 4484_230]|nr:MAG: tRNA lysidine(34) synthetase TilS [Helicobacteraceae bacterium 4484_230]
MIDPKTVPFLQEGKNLLAFSGGVDSSALFFLLLEKKIDFDIAIVNYHTREQSDKEVSYAKKLADSYGKKCFIHHADLSQNNFEAEARRVRYQFFDTLFKSYGYTNLITAHQLDDRFEWFLMQVCKGAGSHGLSGMQSIEHFDGHTRIRPLLQQSKAALLQYLNNHDIRYYIDESNSDERYRRNYFRQRFSGIMLEKYEQGIRNTLNYLQEEKERLSGKIPEITTIEKLFCFQTPDSRHMCMTMIDKILKADGFLMRMGDKNRLKTQNDTVVGRVYAVSITPLFTIIAPFESAVMTKEFKEKCRKTGISANLRPYLFSHRNVFDKLLKIMELKISAR